VVIEPTTLFKRLIELVELFLGWVYPILKHFMHVVIIAQTEQEVKREAAPCLVQGWSGLSIRVAKARGFTGRFDKFVYTVQRDLRG